MNRAIVLLEILAKISFLPFCFVLCTGIWSNAAVAGTIPSPTEKSVAIKTQSSPVSSLPKIVFVSRNPIHNEDPGAVPGLGPKYRTAVVGGRLMVRTTNGSVKQLVGNDLLFDVADPSVSWDGANILFSAIEHPDSSWRIFRIRADGSGLTKITHSDRIVDLSQFGTSAHLFERYDDFDPCFLPDGRIVFASTRYPSMASMYQVLTSNLFVMNGDGTELHRITTERNGAEEPTIDPLTGRIVYTRWWVNVDLPSNVTRTGLTRLQNEALTNDIANIWQVMTIKPDGDQIQLFAGFARTRLGTQAYKPSMLSNGSVLCMYTSNTAMIPAIGGTGVRRFKKGPGLPYHVAGIRSDEVTQHEGKLKPPFAVDAVQIDSRRIVMSYSLDGKEYGLYSCNLDGSHIQKVVDLSGTLELDAQVLRPRRVPAILKDNFTHQPAPLPPTEDPVTYANDDFFRFDCMNIFTNAAVDEPIPDAPRIARKSRIRFFMSPQRQSTKGPDPSIFVKDAEVFYHGGVHEHDIPAEVPLFEQVVDSSGKVLQTTDGKFAHVPGFNFERQGGGTKCVGCHAGHSMIDVPINASVAEWFNLAPSATVSASSFAGVSDPQRVVDRQARTGGDSVIWVSEERTRAFVELRWDFPVEAREFVLYSVPQIKGTSHILQDCELTMYKGTEQVGRVVSTGKIRPTGTRVKVLPTIVDRVRVTIGKFSGTIKNKKVSGLAEVEAIGRLLNDNSELKARSQE